MERAPSEAADPTRDAEPRALAGEHAIVTGGGRGIGAAIARALQAQGATLTLMGRDELALERQAAALRSIALSGTAGGGALVGVVRCDVSDGESVAVAFATARERFGPARVLVNNAGQGASAPFLETTLALWERMLAVNLTGAFLCTQQVLGNMLEARAGRIVNVASTAGLRGYARTAAYAAAKHGLIGLTRALAAEVAKHGVTVNAVCPGYTDTGLAEVAVENLVAAGRSRDDARRALERLNPRGSLIAPDEVASAVAWLCSPGASGITGVALPIAAGEVP